MSDAATTVKASEAIAINSTVIAILACAGVIGLLAIMFIVICGSSACAELMERRRRTEAIQRQQEAAQRIQNLAMQAQEIAEMEEMEYIAMQQMGHDNFQGELPAMVEDIQPAQFPGVQQRQSDGGGGYMTISAEPLQPKEYYYYTEPAENEPSPEFRPPPQVMMRPINKQVSASPGLEPIEQGSPAEYGNQYYY